MVHTELPGYELLKVRAVLTSF